MRRILRRVPFGWKEAVKITRARTAERFGVTRYSRTALNNLDRLLEPYLGEGPGSFLEIGANDGFAQSNTYYLERVRHWRGILVEPLPDLFAKCKRIRTRSLCFNTACVADASTTSVEMVSRALMSVTLGQQSLSDEQARLDTVGNRRVITVPATTLSSVIDQTRFETLTFMSIDVEGAEASVLGGLEWARHTPDWMLVETKHPDDIARLCGPWMDLRAQLTHHDYLFGRSTFTRTELMTGRVR